MTGLEGPLVVTVESCRLAAVKFRAVYDCSPRMWPRRDEPYWPRNRFRGRRGRDERAATTAALADALAAVRESREPETTARNLGRIREVRAQRGAEVSRTKPIEGGLEKYLP